MTHLLVIDPLNLSLRSDNGSERWRSADPFLRELSDLEAGCFEITDAEDPELCRKAMLADGVILGGSERSAWEDSAFNDHLLDLIAICRNNEVPLLAICYGAQLLGRALGGEVGPHPDGIELGAPPIRLTAKGKDHFLFKGIGELCVWSVETHNDSVLTLPPECELLASTAHTPVQAFSFRGLLTGVQFHPEMNADDLRRLWEAFEQTGIMTSLTAEQHAVLAACECDPLSLVIRNFVERVKAPAVSI